jgi:hypothetical protein
VVKVFGKYVDAQQELVDVRVWEARVGIEAWRVVSGGILFTRGSAEVTRRGWEPTFRERFTAEGRLVSEAADLVTRLRSDTDAWILNHQQAFYDQLLATLDEEPLRTTLQRLSGGKAAVATFTRLALPLALNRDDGLRALVSGKESLCEESGTARVSELVRQTRAAPTPTKQLADIMRRRIELFEAELTGTRRRLARSSYRESQSLVSATLTRLRLTRLLLRDKSLVLVPSAPVFGATRTGRPVTRAIQIRNASLASHVVVRRVSIEGVARKSFRVRHSCGRLRPQSACRALITLSPSGPGVKRVALMVTSSAGSIRVPITGRVR